MRVSAADFHKTVVPLGISEAADFISRSGD